MTRSERTVTDAHYKKVTNTGLLLLSLLMAEQVVIGWSYL